MPGDVALEDGVVTGLGLERGRSAAGIATPGLIDLQVNGFAGVDLQQRGRRRVPEAGEALLRQRRDRLPADVRDRSRGSSSSPRCARCPRAPAGARILGAHLEGPFIAATRLGAHDPAGRRDPDVALLAGCSARGRCGS